MKLLDLQKKFDGKYLKYYELTYENKAGHEKKYEIVSRREIADASQIGTHVNGFSIVAVYEKKLLLLREFRMGGNRYIYNLCAGMKEHGETIFQCIERELYEETGLHVKKIIKILPPSFAAIGISDVKTQIAFIEAEGNIEDHSSENEEITAAFYDREAVNEMLEHEEFSSRAQMAAFMYASGILEDILTKNNPDG